MNTPQSRPGDAPFTERTPRVAAARQLTRRAGRERAGRFLVEGAQAVREALVWARAGRGRVHELFVAPAGLPEDLRSLAEEAGVRVSPVTERAAAGLSETVTPQGVVAVCDLLDVPLDTALAGRPTLVAVLVGVSDPGNAGTVVRVADAAGADAVVLAGNTVDPHNGKCVRASTGSLFHLPVARCADVSAVFAACRAAGLELVAADGYADADLASATPGGPTAWVFGSEAHGLPDELLARVDLALRVPIYGAAESLNLATAAAVCLYATAWRQRAGIATAPFHD
ncbi:TrmH family RNA methyltransferase [Actinophytocola xanthii]|uniref:RNA methyltransferase n=1 Tax=Actinophytocola xanthii TaxID=1912961 RepID=A0A1Q8C6C2_9PSEU|nr:RNA methyltransferase [Actinophytocola xanthii]OLF09910.1 RNA methyltransferase [Actinophytocola xanthii]